MKMIFVTFLVAIFLLVSNVLADDEYVVDPISDNNFDKFMALMMAQQLGIEIPSEEDLPTTNYAYNKIYCEDIPSNSSVLQNPTEEELKVFLNNFIDSYNSKIVGSNIVKTVELGDIHPLYLKLGEALKIDVLRRETCTSGLVLVFEKFLGEETQINLLYDLFLPMEKKMHKHNYTCCEIFIFYDVFRDERTRNIVLPAVLTLNKDLIINNPLENSKKLADQFYQSDLDYAKYKSLTNKLELTYLSNKETIDNNKNLQLRYQTIESNILIEEYSEADFENDLDKLIKKIEFNNLSLFQKILFYFNQFLSVLTFIFGNIVITLYLKSHDREEWNRLKSYVKKDLAYLKRKAKSLITWIKNLFTQKK